MIDSVVGGGGQNVGSPASGTGTIMNDDFPSVSIAGTTDGSETGSSPATFTVTQNFASVSDTHVTFTLGGTATGGGVDYTTPTLSVTIPAGSTSVPITISGVVDDQLVEGPETLIATLTGADNGACGPSGL